MRRFFSLEYRLKVEVIPVRVSHPTGLLTTMDSSRSR